MTKWLLQRNSKGKLALSTELKDRVDILPAMAWDTEVTGSKDGGLSISRENIPTSPEIRRKISVEDVASMQRALFPEEKWGLDRRRPKPGDRWDQHTRTVRLSNPKERTTENLKKPPGLEVYDTLVSSARSRFMFILDKWFN